MSLKRVLLGWPLRFVAVLALIAAFVPALQQSASATATFDVNNAGLQELDGNVCHEAATIPPWDWANQDCGGTGAAPVGLFNADYSQAVAPGTTVGGKTISNTIICNDSQATSSCPALSSAGSSDLAFITGSSKDPINPNNNWQCTTKPVTPKDEIDNAYASVGSVVVGGVTHVILHMGIERGITNGTSNAGFWVTQNVLSCDPTLNNSKFTGDHKNGDLLLFATFNAGGAICPNGATSTACVDAFAWSGGAGGSITSTPVLGGEACTVSVTDLCGAVNSANVQTPWGPHNSAATAIPANGFFEVGIDLTNFYAGLGVPVPCLSTFLADTRASGTQGNAISSELHDYLGGKFTNCAPHISTSPTSGTIKLGQSNTDTATVTGTAGFPAPTGTVTFYVCGPLASAPTLSGPNCTPATGTKLTSVTYPTGAVPLGTASPPFTPAQAGTYCYTGVYSGDSNYSSATDSSPSTECFVVTNSSTSTTPSQTAITLGASVTDTANVTFTPAGGPTPTGTVEFDVCGPIATVTAAGPNCTASTTGFTLLDATATLTSGVATSSTFKPTQQGTYCFAATYSGDTNYPSSSDSSSTECFTASPAPAVLKSTVSLDDTVKIVKDSTAGVPSGDVTFKLYGPFTAAPTDAVCTGSTPVVGTPKTVPYTSEGYDGSGNGYWTANVDVPATLNGNPSPVWYAWGASFTSGNTGGNTNYASGSLGCTAEQVQLTYGTGSGFTIPATTPSVTP